MARKLVGKTFEGVTGLRRVVVAFVLFVFLLLVAAFIFFFIRAWPTMNPKLPFPLRVLMASVDVLLKPLVALAIWFSDSHG